MEGTKGRILAVSLELFARNGYEAVSVNDIATRLGITKGALYRHYASKKEIFASIIKRMEAQDAEKARSNDLPEDTFNQMEEKYACSQLEDIIQFSREMFDYWTKDNFARSFRRMLTLEQFRDNEMASLYQQYLAAGPMDYLTDLFDSMGIIPAREMSAAFYGPMHLLYSIYDSGREDEARCLLDEHLGTMRKRLEELRNELPT